MPLVYLHDLPSNPTPGPSLHAAFVMDETDGRWLRPVATAEEFSSFLIRCHADTPHGEWHYRPHIDDRGRLRFKYERFQLFGVTSQGAALYDLTGLRWLCFWCDPPQGSASGSDVSPARTEAITQTSAGTGTGYNPRPQ